MRSVCFLKDGKERFGIRQGDKVKEITDPAIATVQDLLAAMMSGKAPATGAEHALDSLHLLPPVPRPGKVLCIGLNYREHAKESGFEIPSYPAVFVRVNSSLVGHAQPMLLPPESSKFDYEAELAIVIGKRAHRVSKDKALDVVAGYACFNDGSLRDYQVKSAQWTMGKNFDATGAFGPDIVSADELPRGADGLKVICRLNGQVLQNGITSDMIFDVATVVQMMAEVMTLEPGDVIITGTPSGVGFARKPPVWMKAGDVCEIEIDQIGVLRNEIVAA